MEDSFEHPVYSANVIEFVTVGREFCNWIENLNDQPRKDFINTALKILSLLYLKANMLPKLDNLLEESMEKYVTEEDYEFVIHSVKFKMGRFDDYLEVFTAEMQRSDLPLSSAVSENLADIYQDVKDFMMGYRTAVTEIMNDALVEMVENYETYWGQRLVNCLRALHQVYYSGENLEEEDAEQDSADSEHANKDHWFISKRQREFQSDQPDYDDE
jgi:hypothetical protein